MKIVVLGNGILAEEFKNLDFVVNNECFLDFKIEHVLDFDVIINTFNYKQSKDGDESVQLMKKCNVDLPLLLSEFCESRNKRYVHFSTAEMYESSDEPVSEMAKICAEDAYTASKLLGESACRKNDLIIRTKNLFNSSADKENALFRAIINPTPTQNLESYTWSVDLIRSTVALLKNRQKGIVNIASTGYTSQAEICKVAGIENIAPIHGDERYIKLDIEKLMHNFMPMNVNDNISKCFKKLKDDLGE